jgi:ribosomal protein S18 acetylase RimI-like enzyme
MASLTLRRAHAADIPAIARLHIQAWRETYDGWMPAEVLANLDPTDWEARWLTQMSVAATDPAQAVFLALDASGEPAGFGACRRQTSQKLLPLGYDGEIVSLYLLRRIQGQGVGRRLVSELASHLIAHGCRACGFWVFRDSARAREFYERLGAAPTGVEGVWEIFGMVLPDMAYGLKDLRSLAAPCGASLPLSDATR